MNNQLKIVESYKFPPGWSPLLPIIGYYGGKQKMIPHIVPLIPDHLNRCEPFCGGGTSLSFPPPPGVETINDINPFIINFYQAAKLYPELKRMIEATLYYEADYRRARKIWKEFDCQDQSPNYRIIAAWSLFVLCVMGFSNQIGAGFGLEYGAIEKNGRLRVQKSIVAMNSKKKNVDAFLKRIEGVQMTCRDALKLIPRADTAQTWFFVDPPYIDTCQGHYAGYGKGDYENLLSTLEKIEGLFMLTSYPSPVLDEHIKKNGWESEQFQKNVTANIAHDGKGRAQKKKTEVVTVNYEIKQKQGALFPLGGDNELY